VADRKYTNEELVEIGRKVIEARARRAEVNKKRRQIQSQLYKMYTEGKLGNIQL
jgi:hypothetical protein